MSDNRPLWEVVGGSESGGILVRAGEGYQSLQYPVRLVHGARVREVELRGERLHYEKVRGDGPDYGWISIKLKGKDLAVRLQLSPEEGGGRERTEAPPETTPEAKPEVAPEAKPEVAPEAKPVAEVEAAAASARVAVEPAAEEAQEEEEEEGEEEEDEAAELAAAMEAAELAAAGVLALDGAGMMWARQASNASVKSEQRRQVAEEAADDLITVESNTAAGPTEELTEEEKQRRAMAELFKAEMDLEAEAQQRMEGNENKDNVPDRGAFIMINTAPDGGPGSGSKRLFVDAINASFMKVKQEFGKKDCPKSHTADLITRLLACMVLFFNAILPQRFRSGVAQRMEILNGLFAHSETGLCVYLQGALQEERGAPDSGPSPKKEKLSGKLWQVIDALGQLPGLMLPTFDRTAFEEPMLTMLHRYLAFFWHKAILPALGVARDRVVGKEPDMPVGPDDTAPPGQRNEHVATLMHWAFAVLFCGGEMLYDVVFFKPSAFSLRWRIFKTTQRTMVQLLCELRERFMEEEFQKRYKHIRNNARPGDEESIISCALSVQSVVLPKYGLSGDIKGVMEMRGEVAALVQGMQDMCVQKVMKDIHRALDYGEALAKLPFTKVMSNPRFALRDRAAWLKHLNDHGFVVLAEVANAREVDLAFENLWAFIEQTDRTRTVRRGDISSWGDHDDDHCGWPAGKEDGIIHSRGIGQSQLLWQLRSLPSVKQAFAGVWGTDHLVPSFDGAGVFRPYGHKIQWKTKKTNWWHVDQAHRKRGLHCVQGLLTLTDATPASGGLVVVPGSHRFHGAILSSHEPKRSGWDYIGLEANERVLTEGDSGPRLVSAMAGDLILWDSRTIHCNTQPLQEDAELLHGDKLMRAVAYICMTPAAWCSDKVMNQRAAAFKRGVTTSHWPHEFHAMDIDETEPPFNLSKVQRDLLSPLATSNWREDVKRSAPRQGRISLLPEAQYRVARQGAVDVYKFPTTEWDGPISSLKRNTEVTGYIIGNWLRLGSWPRNVPLPDGHGSNDEEDELWCEFRSADGEANFARLDEVAN